MQSILKPLLEYLRGGTYMLNLKPKYILRNDPYNCLLIIVDQHYKIILRYCAVNRQYMVPLKEEYCDKNKELIYSF